MIANFENYHNVMITKYKRDDRGLPRMISKDYMTSDLVLLETSVTDVYEVLKDRYGNNLGDHLNIPPHLLAKSLLGSRR